MKRLLVAVLVLSLCACGTTDHSAADSQATLAPTSAFRDALLLAAVKAMLAGEDIDSTTRVHVGVRNGAVQLSGMVGSEGERARAVAAAQRVGGVKSVDDRMTVGKVGPGAVKRTADFGVEAGVEAAIASQTGVNIARVHVRSSDGIVTLSGSAPTVAIRSTMVAAAKAAPGVRNVVDNIAVK